MELGYAIGARVWFRRAGEGKRRSFRLGSRGVGLCSEVLRRRLSAALFRETGMPSGDVQELRIYCICGQKMKVSSAMFGRPGKCVACSQKIRVPRPDELPEGLWDVYLKDYPQFLRRVVRRVEEPGTEEEPEDQAIGESAERVDVTPIDSFEVIQRLTSYEVLVQKALDRYRGASPGSPEGVEKSTLMGYRALARKARSELDELLRQRLMDAAVELSEIKEQLSRSSLSARVGELGFTQYLETVTPLRRRRETLERLRHNLRGWLTVADPYLAGGLLELSLEDPPVNVENALVPETEPPADQALMDYLIQSLRSAHEEREYAERKLAEWNRVEKEGGLTGFNIERYRMQAEAARCCGVASVAFHQERLQQALQDAENEIKAIRAHLELARHRLEAGELNVAEFNNIELSLLRAQADTAKACDYARQSLRAKRLEEIPRVQTRLFRRLARKGPSGGVGVDSWIAWAGALLLVLAIFFPLVDTTGLGNAVAMRGLTIGLVGSALALALLGTVPNRRWRGIGVGLLWLTFCVGLTLYLHDKFYSLEPVGEIMRRDLLWVFTPGIVLVWGGIVLTAASFMVALLREPGQRHIPFVILASCAVIVGGVVTDVAGYLDPVPVIAQVEQAPASAEQQALGAATYVVSVTVGNDGRRPIWLNPKSGGPPDRVRRPDPVALSVRRKVARGKWEGDVRPLRVKMSNGDWTDVRKIREDVRIGPGRTAVFEFALMPGQYQFKLSSGPERMLDLPVLKEEEAAPEPAVATPPASEPAAPDDQAAPAGTPEDTTEGETASPPAAPDVAAPEEVVEPADPVAPPGPALELQGVGGGPDGEPRFFLSLHFPDGRIHSFRAKLNDTIFGAWKALEYDPNGTRLTIGVTDEDGKRLEFRVLRTGESLALPAATGPTGSASGGSLSEEMEGAGEE